MRTMSKKWFAMSMMTCLLLAGTWYLYLSSPEENILAKVVAPEVSKTPLLTPDLEQTMYQSMTLFVLNTQTGTLVKKMQAIPEKQELVERLTQTIESLIRPDSDSRNEAFPEETALLNIFVSNSGIAYLNLNRHIQDGHVGGLSAELATITSLVNTILFNFQEIKQVQILVEGAEIETLAGHVDCRKPFSKMLLIGS